MARRPNQHFSRPVEKEIVYRAIPTQSRNRLSSDLLKIVRFVDGVEEYEEYPEVVRKEQLTIRGCGAKVTFDVFVNPSFDNGFSNSLDIGIIGENGYEKFERSATGAHYYIGETKIYYNAQNREWSTYEPKHNCSRYFGEDEYY